MMVLIHLQLGLLQVVEYYSSTKLLE